MLKTYKVVGVVALTLGCLGAVRGWAFPLPVLGIHEGVLESLRSKPALKAIVKLKARDGALQTGVCTGSFISDRIILTAAHCFPPKTDAVEVLIGDNDGWFSTVILATEFYQSSEDQDVAVVVTPPGTFKGTPLPFRLWDQELEKEVLSSGNAYAGVLATERYSLTALGYGDTEKPEEANNGDYAFTRRPLLSSVIRSAKISPYGIATTDGDHHIDHGDSGGPLIARPLKKTSGPLGGGFIVGVNHAMWDQDVKVGYFKPVLLAFFQELKDRGVPIPDVNCICSERVDYVGSASNRWSETTHETHSQMLGLSCDRYTTPAQSEEYSDGMGGTVTRLGRGKVCVISR